MTVGILISIIGAISAILVSCLGAILANRNSIHLQTRRLKEEHYISFFESLHNSAASNNKEAIVKYTFARDKLFIIASELVVDKLLEYENKGVGKSSEEHDKYLTELIKAIRADLKLDFQKLPTLYLKK